MIFTQLKKAKTSIGKSNYLSWRLMRICASLIVPIILNPPIQARQATPHNSLAQIPVKEVTVFKDGHAFVVHQGLMKTTEDGNVVMDYLPKPVLGTFWPYCSDKNASLSGAVAGIRRVAIANTSLTVAELIEGNVGAQVEISILKKSGLTTSERIIEGVIDDFPIRSSEELEKIAPPNTGEKLPQKGSIVLIKTASGVRAEPLSNIRTVTFKGAYNKKLSHEELRDLVTLNLNWKRANINPKAEVGLMYLQQGMRWIPNYKVVFDGNGNAKVQLQATIENRLSDLKDVKLNLVVGVPTFPFKDKVDPFALNNTIAQVASRTRGRSLLASQFSNAAILQGATNGTIGPQAGTGIASSFNKLTEITGKQKTEDLYVYSADHITLKKGERMVLPISEFSLKYKDVYKLDIPFSAPPDISVSSRSVSSELKLALKKCQIKHRLRLKNTTNQPFTTAPALMVRKTDDGVERIVSQGLMTYTAPGGQTDLDLTTAIDIRADKKDNIISRTPQVKKWGRKSFGKVSVDGNIELQSFSNKIVDLEVNRYILGTADSVASAGKITKINLFEEGLRGVLKQGRFRYYRFPSWWHHLNGASSIKWNTKLKPGSKVNLNYKWHYFWRE